MIQDIKILAAIVKHLLALAVFFTTIFMFPHRKAQDLSRKYGDRDIILIWMKSTGDRRQPGSECSF